MDKDKRYDAPQKRRARSNPVNWVLVASGVGAIISGIAMIWVGTRGT